MAKPVPNPTSRLRDRLDYHKARRETRTIEHLIDMTCRDFDQIFAAAEASLSHPAALERAERERDGWIESARQAHEGMAYYRGLVDEIGKQLGPDAYTADDGSVSEDVLRAKVPELIGAALERALYERDDAEATARLLSKQLKDANRRLGEINIPPDEQIALIRAEERERCAMVPTYRAQDLRAIISTPSPTYAGRISEFVHRADEADGLAAAIRALGPVLRPSPEAEAPQPTAWLVYDENDDPAHIAHSPEEAAAIVDRLGGAMVHPVFIHPPTTPPALAAPEMRERVRKLLAMPANIDTWMTYCIEAHDILSALFPNQPEPAAAPGHTDLMVSPEAIDACLAANPLPPEPAGDGWIAWGGGHGCPLAYGTRVTIRTREGVEDCDEATVFNWAHAGSPHDIIAYRLSQTDGGAS